MKRFWQIVFLLLLAAGLVLGGFPFVCAAQEEQKEESVAKGEKPNEKDIFVLEEITVTATKREESVLEVPISITAFDSQAMSKLGITSSEDLEQMTPGLQFGTGAGQGTTIRGLSSRLWQTSHADQAVAYYVDGVYSYTLDGVAPDMFDVDRVEVARGPQGTLHGRNSIAGAISFFPKRPTDEWDADALVEVTNQVTERYNIAFGGPIFSWLSFRVTAGMEYGDGAFENIGNGPDAGKPDEQFIFPQLRIRNDWMDINIRYTESEDHGVPWPDSIRLDRRDPTQYWYDKDPLPPAEWEESPWYLNTDPVPVSSFCPPNQPTNQCSDLQLMINTNAPTFTDAMRTGVTVNARFDITDNFTLTYIYGESRSEAGSATDADGMNRKGGFEGGGYYGDGELWWIERHGNFTYSNPLQVDSITGSLVSDIRTRTYYNVDQSSHEMVFASDFDGPFNFIAGAFYYQNETSYVDNDDSYTSSFRFTDNEEAWDEIRLGQNPPQSWGILPIYEEYMRTTHGWDPDTAEYGVDGGLGVAPAGQSECNQFAWALGTFWGAATYSNPTFFLYCDYREDRLAGGGTVNTAATETSAYFMQGTLQLGNWSLEAGARYTRDMKEQFENSYTSTANVAGVIVHSGVDTATDEKPEWEKWIWEASLEYTPAGGNTMYYGRVATGYRAGSFSSLVTVVGFDPPQVGEETLVNYELGVKTQAMDHRLTVTSSAFYSQYDDMQINLSQNYPPGVEISDIEKSPLVSFTANIPTSDLYGFEVDFAYYPHERWRFSGYYTYFDSDLGTHSSVTPGKPNPTLLDREHLILVGGSDYNPNLDNPAYEFSHWDGNRKAVPNLDDAGERIPCSSDSDVCYATAQYVAMDVKTGNTMPKQPHHKLALTGSYTHPLALGRRDCGSLTLLSTYSWTGERHPYIANLPSQAMRAYGRWDIRTIWASPGGNWTATFYVQNLMDDIGLIEYIPVSGVLTPLGNPTGARAMMTDSRRFGAILQWKFGG